MTRTARSVCRFCPGACGTVLELDDAGHICGVKGDHAHAMSEGYACIKGLQAADAANGDFRLLRPLKRLEDGRFTEIDLEVALDEIADAIRPIIAIHGPEAVGLFKGTAAYFNVVLNQMLPNFMAALGSPSFFSTTTIDQSAKAVTAGRMGYWDAGRHRFHDADVLMLVGTNPLVSISTNGYVMFNATKQMKRAKARGMKLIVVDPRETETARHADVFLQPVPGEDATLIAGMIHQILERGWHDVRFCDRYVGNLDRLRVAVEPFGPERVRARCGIEEDQLIAAARTFACGARRGLATTGTGATMAPHSNLTDHLVECLNVVCGRMLAPGDPISNPGVLTPRRGFRAEVIPPSRSWEAGHRGRTGFGTIAGEMMSNTLADEILLDGPGQIRALLIAGGNPAVALPDQRKAVGALRALDLMVAIEPYMTPTARLCHYILPPKLMYERTDVLFGPALEAILDPVPFQQFIPAVSKPPDGAQVADDWYVFWALARRLDLALNFAGVPISLDEEPTTEELLAVLLRDAQIPFDELMKHPNGHMFDVPGQHVEEGGGTARFDVAPNDVLEELDTVASYPIVRLGRRQFRLTVRRQREVMNTTGQLFPAIRKVRAFNPAYLHPDDLDVLRVSPGTMVEVHSDHGWVRAVVEADASLRRGVVSMSHCWGGLPDDGGDPREGGSSTNLLVSSETNIEAINAMPWMSAVDVDVIVAKESMTP
jgi:anaerobic selenocysteine-containing dehydrogenase